MEFKVGDKVTIKSEDEIKKFEVDEDGDAISSQKICFGFGMYDYCEQIATIKEVKGKGHSKYYTIDIDEGYYAWDGEFFKEYKPCEFCKGDEFNFDGLRLHKSDNNLIINGQEIEIKYCPFCGKEV